MHYETISPVSIDRDQHRVGASVHLRYNYKNKN